MTAADPLRNFAVVPGELPNDLADSADARIAALQHDVLETRSRLAQAEAMLAQRRQTRLGMAARVLVRAVKDPLCRRSVVRDLGRALLDRAGPSLGRFGRSRFSYLPEMELPSGGPVRPELAVAVILDPFSELAFRYEWNQVTFGPDDWHEILTAQRPTLLFVESAWNGNRGRWRLHMTRDARPSRSMRELVSWCRERQIPTVFWNKEDPPNYDRFVESARLFDFVFTVDEDCIPRYRADLGHERIALLPFGAQPRLHNPIRRGAGRVYDVAFAGTYFADKHKERRAQMDFVLDPARQFGLHIYSRFQAEDQRYQFPARYLPHIVGSLPYEQMLAAYTSYKVFLNVNSVARSPSMCARRLFELSAAQTAVVSGPAESIPRFFGDTITAVCGAKETAAELRVLLRHPEIRERRALRAHRRVFDEHLYSHRVETVLDAVGLPAERRAPSVSVIVPTNRPHQLENVLGFVGRQVYAPRQLVLVLHGFEAVDAEIVAQAKDAGIDEVVICRAANDLSLGRCMNIGLEVSDGDYVAKMDDDNWYGPNYLLDLVRAFSYTDAEVVGKWAHFVHLQGSGATLLRFGDAEHRYVDLVQGGTIVVRRSTAAEVGFEDLPRRVDTAFLDTVRAAGGPVYSADRFNFVSIRGADTDDHTWQITDKQLLAAPTKLLFYGEPFRHAEA